MSKRHTVTIKVISQRGKCSTGHKIEDEWQTDGRTPEGICLNAFGMLLPNIRTLMFGGSFPWEDEEGVGRFSCPDAENPVVFELRRVDK